MENAGALAPPTLTRSSSSAKAMAALTSLASQAKGFTAALPKFLAPSLQKKAEPAITSKSHSSSALSTSEETSSEADDRQSVDERPPPPPPSSSFSRPSLMSLPRRSRLGSEDAVAVVLLLPWELTDDESGAVVENATVRDKIFELSLYRRTFVEDADGEDEYTFQYAKHKDVARRLLLSDPSLREKHTDIVQSATFVVSEETFWRNFFLRCNAVRVAKGLPPYLPPIVRSSLAAVASFQRFRRDVFLKTQRSSAELEKLRRSILQPKRSATVSVDENDPRSELDLALGDLELDLDGEIERELMRRRPSRAVAYRSGATAADANEATRASEPCRS